MSYDITKLAILLVGIAVCIFNYLLNDIVSIYNKHQSKTVDNYVSKKKEGTENKMMDKVFQDLIFTIYENWMFAGFYLAFMFNVLLVSEGKSNLIEIPIIYFIVSLAITQDFIVQHKTYFIRKWSYAALILLSMVHVYTKSYGIDIFIYLYDTLM